MMRAVESLTHQEFTDNLDTRFTVQTDTGSIEVELTELSDLHSHPGQEYFSIVVRGPNEVFLDQGLRHFAHPVLGEFELFIVPIKQDSLGYYYEAIFNRLFPTR